MIQDIPWLVVLIIFLVLLIWSRFELKKANRAYLHVEMLIFAYGIVLLVYSFWLGGKYL